MLLLSDILHQMHWIVIVVACLLCVMAATGSRRRCVVLLVAYLGFILYMTLMGERGTEPGLKLQLFWCYKRFFRNAILRQEILNNIWLFVPVGALLYWLLPKWYVVLIPPIMSLFIEVMQYTMKTGLFEFDDMVSNSLGGLIGMLMCMAIRLVMKRR